MTMVDLDFEEQLKETDFPDLLRRREPTAAAVAKKASTDKAFPDKQKRMNVRRMGRQLDRSTQKIMDTMPRGGEKSASRPAIDPPSSLDDSKEYRDDSKDKTSLSAEDDLLDSLLGDSHASEGKHREKDRKGTVHKDFIEDEDQVISRVAMAAKKGPVTKFAKRDFIEQVCHGRGDSRTPEKLPGTCERAPSNKEGNDWLLGGGRGYEVKFDSSNSDPESDLSEERGTRDFLERMRLKPANSAAAATPAVKAFSPSDGTSKTETSDFSPKAENHCLNDFRINDRGSKDSSVSSLHEAEDDDEDASTASSGSDSESSQDGAELLERARDRIARQHLTEQVEELKGIIERKNEEIEGLSGQLRRAVETKCDLVIAHNELERAHENVINRKENNLIQMKKANIWLLETQSMKEKELLNEIIRLTDHCKATEQRHREELDDWERMHRNAMLEKDFEIAKLAEDLRKIQGGAATAPMAQSALQGAAKYFLYQ